ncbi:predicted protein [Postia placenta Mad-698-R]|uniref:Uncharacterized protein n=1 Tax=Postia placenta MAD-698-R-SB12 TaxID=670580 RepID=A0A1X6N3T0_9APHY|nr:hypothetical protein POSPLADRAFT_1139031 [Postia placenta MAD-698-R-SB12]EED85916.1 predicted protein [Postia placenta Mad-698-R]OSX63245.1 hypothetical protein POSPLADRAFT_1139031 [Postia placenta MAD-698-R-SB12]
MGAAELARARASSIAAVKILQIGRWRKYTTLTFADIPLDVFYESCLLNIPEDDEYIFWRFSARYCKGCRKQLTIDYHQVPHELKRRLPPGATTIWSQPRLFCIENNPSEIAHVWSGVGPDDAGRKIVREYLSELVKQADTSATACEAWYKSKRASERYEQCSESARGRNANKKGQKTPRGVAPIRKRRGCLRRMLEIDTDIFEERCLAPNLRSSVLWEFGVRYCYDCRASIMLWLGGYELFFNTIPDPRIPQRNLFHIPQVEQICQNWSALALTETLRGAFLETVADIVRVTATHAKLCRDWQEYRVRSRAQEIEDIKRARSQLIEIKLRALGWDRMVEQFKAQKKWNKLPHMHTRKALTESGWERICPDIVGELQKASLAERKGVLERRLMLLKKYMRTYSANMRSPASECRPRFLDFALLPAVRAVIESPSSDIVDTATFQAMHRQIAALIGGLDTAIRVAFQTKATHTFVVPFGANALVLAMALFACTACKKRLYYPHVIAHQCHQPHLSSVYRLGRENNLYRDVARKVDGATSVWSADGFEIADHRRTAQLLQACGKDPQTTTVEEMDRSDIRICFVAPAGGSSRQIMTWRAADDWTNGEGRLASRQEVCLAQDAESRTHASSRAECEAQPYWCCALCTSQPLFRLKEYDIVKTHLYEHHHILLPSDDDIYLHPDGRPMTPKCVTLPVDTEPQA